MSKKSILVFGSAGFIGTYLVDELLRAGHQVVASDFSAIGEEYYRRNEIEYVKVDITIKSDFENIPRRHYDAVIHLAALQPANFRSLAYEPEDYIRINVVGTLNILEYCRVNKVRKIIYASSHRNTAGLWARGRAIKEEDGRALDYHGEYAMFSISESAAQDLVDHYASQYALQGIIFRLPPVYGFGPHLEIFKNGKPMKTGFQTFIENAMACKPLEVWGDDQVGRDIIYVKDVVSAFMKALDNDKANGLFNITSGYLLTLREEVETIARVFWGDGTPPIVVARPEIPHRMDSFLYANAKANRELGWTPAYNFEAMLIDYKIELQRNKFGYLVDKRSTMFNDIFSKFKGV
jgi:UDP-glucose 4-epimerase